MPRKQLMSEERPIHMVLTTCISLCEHVEQWGSFTVRVVRQECVYVCILYFRLVCFSYPVRHQNEQINTNFPLWSNKDHLSIEKMLVFIILDKVYFKIKSAEIQYTIISSYCQKKQDELLYNNKLKCHTTSCFDVYLFIFIGHQIPGNISELFNSQNLA